jgi:hypothetical protein
VTYNLIISRYLICFVPISPITYTQDNAILELLLRVLQGSCLSPSACSGTLQSPLCYTARTPFAQSEQKGGTRDVGLQSNAVAVSSAAVAAGADPAAADPGAGAWTAELA